MVTTAARPLLAPQQSAAKAPGLAPVGDSGRDCKVSSVTSMSGREIRSRIHRMALFRIRLQGWVPKSSKLEKEPTPMDPRTYQAPRTRHHHSMPHDRRHRSLPGKSLPGCTRASMTSPNTETLLYVKRRQGRMVSAGEWPTHHPRRSMS